MKIEKLINSKICIGIIILLNCLIYYSCFSYNYLQDGDEFSSLAFPVYLAGGDWSNIIAATTSWHGYGHVLVYAPFFRFCRTWEAMYNICRIGCLLNWIFLSVFIFYLALKYFDLGNINSLLVSLVCTVGNLKPDYGIGLSTETELPMGIIAVFVMFFLFKAKDSVGYKNKMYSFLLLMLMFYSLTIHSRTLVLILTVLTVVFIELIFRKKIIISPFWSMVGAGSGFLIYKLLNNSFIRNVMTADEGIQGSLANDIVNVQSSGVMQLITMFSSWENIETVFKMFFSLLSGFVILSFGVISLFIIVDVQYIILRWRCKEIDNLEIGILVGLFSFFLMNIFIAIKEYQNVLNGDKRWLLYLRYAMPFAILIVFTGLIVILKKQCNFRKITVIATLINVCIILFFLIIPLQDLKDTNVMQALANIFRQYFYKDEKVDEYFFRMIKIALFGWLLAFIFLRKNKQVLVWIGYTAISVVFMFSSIKWHYNRAQVVYTYTNSSERVIRELEKDEDLVNIKIYCNAKNELSPRYLRTSCPWSELYYVRDENFDILDLSNSIVLSDNKSLSIDNKKTYKIELDNNEYLYTKNRYVYDWINTIWTGK